jgi:hypothetical protein
MNSVLPVLWIVAKTAHLGYIQFTPLQLLGNSYFPHQSHYIHLKFIKSLVSK